MSKKSILLVVWLALLGGLLFGITRMSGQDPVPPAPGQPPPGPTVTGAQWAQVLAHAAAPPRGGPKARYTIAEFGDFQCPQCGRAWPLLEALVRTYPEQVNMVFVHRPFPNFHPWALPTAEAAQAAAAQGKFWPMYDALYSHQADLEALAPAEAHKGLPAGALSQYAAAVGLDVAQFEGAMNSHDGRASVNRAAKFADSLGVQLTPTFLVHDSVKGTVTAYTGLLPKDLTGERPGTLYFDRDFLNRLPWISAAPPP